MELKKIAELIRKKGIRPSDAVYHTWRDLSNRKGEMAGKVRILVLKDGIARVEYICPHCREYGYQEEEEWKRPFRFRCQHCGKSISVPKLKDQVKREMKKAKL